MCLMDRSEIVEWDNFGCHLIEHSSLDCVPRVGFLKRQLPCRIGHLKVVYGVDKYHHVK